MAFPTWRDNPQYYLTYEGSGKVMIYLSQGEQSEANIGFYVYDLKESQGKLIYNMKKFVRERVCVCVCTVI
jgi:ATP-dependent RNA circularization protein (DNA/RNA ligase family)